MEAPQLRATGSGDKAFLYENRRVSFTLTGTCQALGIGEAFLILQLRIKKFLNQNEFRDFQEGNEHHANSSCRGVKMYLLLITARQFMGTKGHTIIPQLTIFLQQR